MYDELDPYGQLLGGFTATLFEQQPSDSSDSEPQREPSPVPQLKSSLAPTRSPKSSLATAMQLWDAVATALPAVNRPGWELSSKGDSPLWILLSERARSTSGHLYVVFVVSGLRRILACGQSLQYLTLDENKDFQLHSSQIQHLRCWQARNRSRLDQVSEKGFLSSRHKAFEAICSDAVAIPASVGKVSLRDCLSNMFVYRSFFFHMLSTRISLLKAILLFSLKRLLICLS